MLPKSMLEATRLATNHLLVLPLTQLQAADNRRPGAANVKRDKLQTLFDRSLYVSNRQDELYSLVAMSLARGLRKLTVLRLSMRLTVVIRCRVTTVHS